MNTRPSTEARASVPQLRRRSASFSVVAGFIFGCLVTGLVVPTLVKRNTSETVATAARAGGSGAASSDQATDATSGLGESGATGSAAGDELAGRADGSGPSVEGPASGDAGGSGAPLTASDVGVTDSTILVGGIIQDVGAIGKLGFGAASGLTIEQQQRAYDTFINAVNASGGINGRRLVGTYATVDLSNPDSFRAACLKLTNDKKVFAVITGPGGFSGGARCTAIENKTPLVISDTTGIPTEWVTEAAGRIATVFDSSQRMAVDFVSELTRIGLLQGRTLGILADQSDAGRLMVDTALVPALQQAGYSVKYISRLSADTGTAASQMPIEVQQMRNNGVNSVLVTATVLYHLQFAQAANAQGYNPKYLMPDWGATSDAGDENMPGNFDGVFISANATYDYNNGLPDTPAAARCRQIYEASNEKLTRDDSGSALRMDFTLGECDLVDIFVRAARAAGPNLTRQSFVDAMQTLGAFPLSAVGPGSYDAGKLEYSDAVRANVWTASCKCWKPTRSF